MPQSEVDPKESRNATEISEKHSLQNVQQPTHIQEGVLVGSRGWEAMVNI